MTVVTYGDGINYATILYDREARICIVVGNSISPLSGALSVAKSLGADSILVIGPPEVKEALGLVPSKELVVYEL